MQKVINLSDTKFDPLTRRSCDGCGKNDRHSNYSEVFIMYKTLEEKMDNENTDYCDECYPFYARAEQQKNKCVECKKLSDEECDKKHLNCGWDIITRDSNIHPKCLDGNIGKEKRKCTPNPFSKGLGCSVCAVNKPFEDSQERDTNSSTIQWSYYSYLDQSNQWHS
jgi:hypothetical protein|tara:strand:+ start:1767 stop:2264 length:498 start_codon:yes stop_codon:yes gene_type:complete